MLYSSDTSIVPITPCKGLECGDIVNNRIQTFVASTEASPAVLNREASIGRHPNKPTENSADAPQAHPNDPSTPTTRTTRTSRGSQNAVQCSPSARNNYNQPAASANDPSNPATAPITPINMATRRDECRPTITRDKLTDKPRFSNSGLDRDKSRQIQGDQQNTDCDLENGSMPCLVLGSVLPAGSGSGAKHEMHKKMYTASGEKATDEYDTGLLIQRPMPERLKAKVTRHGSQ
ncbi:hypothetical protein G6011_11246 [Alternaria panax]|uniref:Uncharacterized protein n=1 Tax=Alternaria panax TaxID=48097 RepID=A0AAD4IDD2_9PLEO|nr:hypothetical protein G6011_11246 [Alternaria panax]